MASEEELVVKMTLEDDLSRQVSSATKSLNALGRELEKAREEAERSGDPSNYEGLQAKFKEEQRALIALKRQREQARKDVKAMERDTTRAAGKMQGAWKRLQSVFKNPLFTAATIAGVALFGRRAVEAFAQAEQSQMKLVQAYEKFGAISDVPIESMRALASELQSLTGTDDDLLAAAAATLARFDLTGTAIQGLLPLVNDFAILTGRDVVEASEAIGKAFMGNARALKELGINFTATGDRGKDLETIMAALDAKAGGTGDAFGQTAAGGLARAQEAFGDLQEEIGGTLVPALTAMLRVVEPAAKFFSALPGPIKGTAIAIGVLAAAALALGPRLATMVIGMRAAGIEATAMRTKMAAAGSFVAGPFGAALAAGTVALTYFMMEQAEASARVDAFAGSIDNVTGKLNQAGVAKVSETLMGDISPDDWQLLEKFGFTVDSVTATVIGGADAWERFREQKAQAVNEAAIGKERELLSILESNVMGLRKDVEDGTRAWEAAGRGMEIAADIMDDTASATGGVTRQLVVLGRTLPLASYQASDYYQALAAAKRATDGLTQSLSDLSAAVNEWGSRDNFKASLKAYLEEPTAEAARTMITNMEQAAASIEDPGERAAFTVDAIGRIEKAFQSSGLKVPQAVRDSLNETEADALAVKTATDLIKSSIDAIPDSKTVRFFLETTGRAPASVTYNAHGGYIDSRIGGPTSDSVPAMLSRGEYVLRAGAVDALRRAVGEAGLWQLNHSDRSMPSFLDSPVPPLVPGDGREPALVGAGAAPVINIGEIRADSGIDVQSEVLWAMRRADRIRRERG